MKNNTSNNQRYNEVGEEVIKTMYSDNNTEELASTLNKSVPSVYVKAFITGVRKNKRSFSGYQYWSEKEIVQLKQLVEDGVPITEIAKKLNRTYSSTINAKNQHANTCTIKRKVTDSKTKDFIVANIDKSIDYLVEKTGLAVNTIKKLQSNYRIYGTPYLAKGCLHKWSKKEDDYIKDNYNSMTDKQIATKLNKTINSVVMRRKTLNLSKGIRNNWSKDELKLIKRLLKKGKTHKYIAKHVTKTYGIERTIQAVSHAILRLRKKGKL